MMERESPSPAPHEPCLCKRFCTDSADESGTCKGLPDAPREPLIEVVLIHKDDLR